MLLFDPPADPDPALPAGAEARRVCVLVNRKSGGQEDDRVSRISAALEARFGPRAELRTPPPDQVTDAARAAAAEGFDVVAAAGGDGTVAAAAEGLAGGPAALGVIPQGTFNYFARGHGIPEEIEGAADLLLSGAPRAVPVGRVNGRIFVNNASIGVYPAILRAREGIYARYGRSRIAAYWSVLRTMLGFRRPMKLVVEANGETLRLKTPLAFVASSAYQLDLIGVDGAPAVRDGKLALFLAPDEARGALIRRAVRVGVGMSASGEDYRLIAAEKIRIESDRKKRLLARDGEKARMEGPYAFELLPDALRVIAPADPARASAAAPASGGPAEGAGGAS